MKTVHLLYGREGMELSVPDSAHVLTAHDAPPLPDPVDAIARALEEPIGCAPLRQLITARRPRHVAVTVSDITRHVPNRLFLPLILKTLNECGVPDSSVVIIIGTGMHRPSTPSERETIVGPETLSRVEVVDHCASDPSTLVTISDDPPVRVCRRFAQADFRIVTGFVEPHFMAGFSGGRKGVCPALVDLATVQRFHGYATLADPRAESGVLEGNPCHEIALGVARRVGVDFILNVTLTQDRRLAGVFAGHLEAAHTAACLEVREHAATVLPPYDLVVTCGGGHPLDQTFYQSVKGMCAAMPALSARTTLLQASLCAEAVGSPAYTELMLRYDNDWRRFLDDIAARPNQTLLDQWEYQMQCRVLGLIGMERLWFACDGIPIKTQRRLSVTPLPGPGGARQRAQRAIDAFIAQRPGARVAVIPTGPFTLLRAPHA
ncbi:MAG TPA: nickel-dependent lactate racemase [Candidatus Brocadiia bacterium]|nr:nickel-dependent lactate racemase [Candidatus Brocadiia bacterium]